MTTIGWLLILTAFLIGRAGVKGRMITEIPGDLGDLFTAVVTGNQADIAAVLRREGDSQAAVASDTATAPSGGGTGTAATPGTAAGGESPGTVAGLVAFGKRLEAGGYSVKEHSQFGGVCTNNCHTKGSQHYKDEAIDVNADTGFRGGEKVALDNANAMAKAVGFTTLWRVANHLDHLHVAIKRG